MVAIAITVNEALGSIHMTIRFPRMRSLLVPVLAILAGVTSASAFSLRSDSPRLYLIQGYLDRAPDGANVIDRVEIAATGKPTRHLLVTSYRSSGGTLLASYLSRQLISPYRVFGNSGNVSRLLGAPEGSEIKGTFAFYTEAVPSLLIAELDLPA